jgi:CheY-like chemotaxis protein
MNEIKGTIVLVDDEPTLAEALAFTLESLGFECIKARDMTSGVKALKKHMASALVTDIMMPAGEDFGSVDSTETGFRFIDFVQANWPRLPIICLSVIGDEAKIRSLTKRGVRYLRKGETPLSTAVEVITAIATGRRPKLGPRWRY